MCNVFSVKYISRYTDQWKNKKTNCIPNTWYACNRCHSRVKYTVYCQTSNISHTLVRNKLGDHSDVVRLPVSAASTTSSFSTDWAKTTGRWDKKHLSLENWYTWWRHQMETFSALLAICAGNSPVPGEFPTQRPVTRSFDVYFDLRPDKRLSKQSWGWWFETLSHSLWRHRNDFMLEVWRQSW